MKKAFLKLATAAAVVASLGLAAPALAQNSAVTNAILSQKSGQLDKALVSINEAINNDKTKDKAKTWFTRGEIYNQLIDPSTAALYTKFTKDMQPGEPLQKAVESYNKALQLDGPTGEFGKQVPDRLKNLYGQAFNAGVASFNAKDYDKAISSYKLASQINPQDTTAVLYGAYALDAKQDYAGAKASYTQLLGMGYKSPTVYNRLLAIAQQQNDAAATQQVLQQAIKAYPNDKNFLTQELNMYISTGRGKEAIDKIKHAIEVDPNNSNLYGVLGSVYDQNKQPELAVEAFKKAVELDPKNFDAQFNLGIYNFNQAATYYTKASKLDLKTYQLKGRPLEAQGKKYFEASVPYFEKALEVQPNDAGSLSALQKVYYRLGRTADSKRMEDRLQALKK
ncbi:tetratricopeptide repeat protein [Hymenobacter sp. HMF4947]|uniref:Tetratricopeptide repeat protein n=1 Tax=Hymenobacter ginkgonis TaxID=2682976 RepID=A0A7K1TBB2_9BACT|nr:tetratricopeptide repeat protein [Hymenobacter ginkgonis]MVN75698.1 tetratricopeptide repeat protein [Hymenobacter ginkgonis]